LYHIIIFYYPAYFLSFLFFLNSPGQYQVSRRLGSDWRNPKNIMLSSSERNIFGKPKDIPGPGEYEIAKDLIRPSHNVLLSDI